MESRPWLKNVPPESDNFLRSTSCASTFPQVRPQILRSETLVVHILFPRPSTASGGAPHRLRTELSTGVDNPGLPPPPVPPSVIGNRLPDRYRGRSEGKPSGPGSGSPGACSAPAKVSVRAFLGGITRHADQQVRLSLRQEAVG